MNYVTKIAFLDFPMNLPPNPEIVLTMSAEGLAATPWKASLAECE